MTTRIRLSSRRVGLILRHSIRHHTQQSSKHSAAASTPAIVRTAPPAAAGSSITAAAAPPAALDDGFSSVAASPVLETAAAPSPSAGARCPSPPPASASPHRFSAAHPLCLRLPATSASSSSSFARRSEAASPPAAALSPPLSAASSWLSCYDDVWEDGTGAESSGLSETRGTIDYYYVQDEAEDCRTGEDEAADDGSLRQAQQQGAEVMMAGDEHGAEATVDTDRFPREWFEPRHRLLKEESVCDDEEEEQYSHSAGGQPQQQQLITVEDESYAHELMGMAMLGLYCSGAGQDDDDADSDPAPILDASPLPSMPSFASRQPSSRARSEHNHTNPIHIHGRHGDSSGHSPSTPTSSSPPPSGSGSGSYPSPSLSPLASTSPTFSTSSSSSSSPAPESSSPTSATRMAHGGGGGDSDSDDSGGEGRGRQPRFSPDYDPSIHLRAQRRLSRRVNAHALSDKLYSRSIYSSASSSYSSSSSSSSSPSSSASRFSSAASAEELLQYERFSRVVQLDGSLTLSSDELPNVASWACLGSFLIHAPRVTSLSFRSVPITAAALEQLGKAVFASIRSLAFSDNHLGLQSSSLPLLCSLLAGCLRLQSLAITRNSLTDISTLCQLVSTQRYLLSLSLSDNGIDRKGAVSLASALRQLSRINGSALQSVDLSYNRVDECGVEALRQAREELVRTAGMDVQISMQRMTPPSALRPAGPASATLAPLTLPSALSVSSFTSARLPAHWLRMRGMSVVTQLLIRPQRAAREATAPQPVSSATRQQGEPEL